MKDSQIEKMSVKELRELQDQIEEAIKTAMTRDRMELRAKMAALADEHGLTLQEILGGGKERKARSPVAIKFRNPKNADETWTGRGRKPNWMAKLGGDVEKYRI